MFGLLRTIISGVIVIAFAMTAWWYVTTPQPPQFNEKMAYLGHTMRFELRHQFKKTEIMRAGLPVQIAFARGMADRGNTAAQIYAMRAMFEAAKTWPNYYQDALAYIRPLSERGYPIAQNAYGVMLRDGLGGVVIDRIEAYKWFLLASEQGHDLATVNAERLSRAMTAPDILEAQQRSNMWRLEKASGGNRL
jgi:TPR repeat protein